MKKYLNIILGLILMALVILLLSVIIPMVLGFSPYVVISGSMEPKLPVGSIVFVKPTDPLEIKPGDCISYDLDGMSVTHRVISVDPEAEIFITKGDANKIIDEPVPFSNYIGKTSDFVILYIGYFTMFIKSAPGMICIAVLAAMAIALAAFLGVKHFHLRHA